jgi:hypothetical protein
MRTPQPTSQNNIPPVILCENLNIAVPVGGTGVGVTECSVVEHNLSTTRQVPPAIQLSTRRRTHDIVVQATSGLV